MEMTDTDNANVRLVAVIVALTNVLEVGSDLMRHTERTPAPAVWAIAGALNGAEAALRTLQRECPALFRAERG